MGVFGAGPASADPVPLKLWYTCSVGVHDRSGTVQIDADVPKSAAVDKPTPQFSIRATVPVSAAETRGLRGAGIKALKGTVKAKVRVTAPGVGTDLGVTFHVASTNVPESGPFSVRTTGVAPKLTFGQPGRAKITVGDLLLHVTASGGMTVQLDVPCKLNTGQDNVVALLDITEAKTTTGPVPPKTPDTATSGTSGSQSPSESVEAGAGTEESAGPSGSLATTGSQGVAHLIPLVTGAVVLGALAAAAAFRFRSRSR
ncbi:DUF6801 domain-containing protein [Streptomyces sp. NPDC059134]|uniref:DUF6801 domain-containing protein n=1 Tax=Streptomyces sp. NPDC059134 TaxID=3346738 RepID=UPI00367BBD0D